MAQEVRSLKCPNCGAQLSTPYYCEYCNTHFAADETPQVVVVVQPPQSQQEQHYYEQPQYSYQPPQSMYNKWVAFVLCVFLGVFGAHYFYVGRWGMGIVYILTVGIGGIGWLFDMARILLGVFPDKYGTQLK